MGNYIVEDDLLMEGVLSREKVFHIIFLVDTSMNMALDNRMEEVNNAFEKLVPELKKIQLEHQWRFEYRISIMTFDNEAKWLAKSIPVMDYNHTQIEADFKGANYTKAFDLLDISLSRKDLFAGFHKIAAPYIMFLTGGRPLDDFYPSLDILLKNGWFNASNRYAVLIGPEAINDIKSKELAKRFNGGDEREGIINCEDTSSIMKAVMDKTQAFLSKGLRYEKKLVDSPDVYNKRIIDTNSVNTDVSDNPFGIVDLNVLFGSGVDFK